jgi:hypothetical protein
MPATAKEEAAVAQPMVVDSKAGEDHEVQAPEQEGSEESAEHEEDHEVQAVD